MRRDDTYQRVADGRHLREARASKLKQLVATMRRDGVRAECERGDLNPKGDQDYLVIYDEEHSEDEDRFVAIGPIGRGVVHTEPGDDVIRIISARMATRAEEQLFYEYSGGRKR